jgi:2-polyprenyl-6-methoxyphenol hydroxylase-like FAD-dependent oxidoreductase
MLRLIPFQNEDEDQVIATIKQIGAEIYEITAKHLIACDGRRSNVRKLLEIPSGGEGLDRTMTTNHFSSNLQLVVGDRVGM